MFNFNSVQIKFLLVEIDFLSIYSFFVTLIIAVRWLHAEECMEHDDHQFCTLSFSKEMD